MKLLRLTVFSFLFVSVIFSMTSCEKDAEKKKTNEFSRTAIALTGAQETPPNASTASGSMDVLYTKGSKVLSYKVKWENLSDTIVGIHIHGQAPTGFAATIVQNILTTKNEAGFPFRGGSYTGTLLIDGAKIKEQDLLNGFYYLNIHSKTYPAGEIRGQIKFQ